MVWGCLGSDGALTYCCVYVCASVVRLHILRASVVCMFLSICLLVASREAFFVFQGIFSYGTKYGMPR